MPDLQQRPGQVIDELQRQRRGDKVEGLVAEGQRLLIGLHAQPAALAQEPPYALHLDHHLDAWERAEARAEKAALSAEIKGYREAPPHQGEPLDKVTDYTADQEVVPAGRSRSPLTALAQQVPIEDADVVAHSPNLVGDLGSFNWRGPLVLLCLCRHRRQ